MTNNIFNDQRVIVTLRTYKISAKRKKHCFALYLRDNCHEYCIQKLYLRVPNTLVLQKKLILDTPMIPTVNAIICFKYSGPNAFQDSIMRSTVQFSMLHNSAMQCRS